MSDDTVVLRNTEKCPFASSLNFTRVSSSLSSTSSDHQNDTDKLLWAPEITPVKLQNYQTGQSVTVTGPQSKVYHDCRHQVCTSTLMALPAHPQNKSSAEETVDELESKLPDYIRKEAYDYQSIYHTDKNTAEADYKRRLEEMDIELKNTGTYSQTTEEIEYGCQLAWRNAARCINRLFWRTLKVIDRRGMKTNDEMFAAICDHLRLAFNKGTLQATTLVMNPQARLWSTQYLRYACYELADGSLLGDPTNRQLTKAAMKLGWNKPEKERTQWDLLPIIVQIHPNVAPSWYDLPQDLRLEIFLSHPDPKYDAAIKKLGLRWVVQPFVADKAIEIGGLIYRCVPFSGWFMQTEIGRNLCDVQRYNMIPKLAALMNLDVTAAGNSQLNIDRLYVEVNAAVLYSFERAKVSIVDHHTAAAGFMKFMKQDINQRGNTPADWIWLVPPISGGMSSLFHQEMLNYIVKPRVLDQRDPWTYYAPFMRNADVPQSSTKRKPRNRWLVVRAACAIIGFALAALKQRISINVLYASASGTAQSYAQQMAKRLVIVGYNAQLMELDSYPFQQTTNTRSIVFIITSTFGQGNAPDGGQKVEEWLRSETDVNTMSGNNITKRNSYRNSHLEVNPSNSTSLHWCSYAVCAIGSSAYPFFCGFGKLVDTTFQSLGAQRLAPLVTCDALNQQYKSYNEWEENTIMALKKAYPHACSRKTAVKSTLVVARNPSLKRPVSYVEQQVSLNTAARPTFVPLTFDTNLRENVPSQHVGTFTKENPYSATVLQNIELVDAENIVDESTARESQTQQPTPSDNTMRKKKVTIPSSFANVSNDESRSVRLIVLESTGLTHYPGDHVCILPENTIANVNGVIKACGWQLQNKLLNDSCSLTSYTNGRYQTLRQILTNFVDLTTPLRPHTLNTIATYANDVNEQRQILELGKGGQRYTDWLVNAPTVKETLEMFRSVRIPLEELIQVSNSDHMHLRMRILFSNNNDKRDDLAVF